VGNHFRSAGQGRFSGVAGDGVAECIEDVVAVFAFAMVSPRWQPVIFIWVLARAEAKSRRVVADLRDMP
jgi:hypothetical protein